jgi:hypothetical protein
MKLLTCYFCKKPLFSREVEEWQLVTGAGNVRRVPRCNQRVACRKRVEAALRVAQDRAENAHS